MTILLTRTLSNERSFDLLQDHTYNTGFPVYWNKCEKDGVLGFFDLEDAQNNLAKTSTLTRMLYPEYSKVDSASTISKGSLIKMKFANLIFDASRGPEGDVRTSGLLGII